MKRSEQSLFPLLPALLSFLFLRNKVKFFFSFGVSECTKINLLTFLPFLSRDRVTVHRISFSPSPSPLTSVLSRSLLLPLLSHNLYMLDCLVLISSVSMHFPHLSLSSCAFFTPHLLFSPPLYVYKSTSLPPSKPPSKMPFPLPPFFPPSFHPSFLPPITVCLHPPLSLPSSLPPSFPTHPKIAS